MSNEPMSENDNDTVHANQAVSEACNVTSTDTSRPILCLIHLEPHGPNSTRITSTDSYRAVTAIVDTRPFDQPMVHDPVNGTTWNDVEANATPVEGRYPKMEHIFSSPREGVAGVPLRTTTYNRYGNGVDGDMAGWAYFDGERRKPSGFVKLSVEDSVLRFTLGMKVQDDKRRVPTVTMWETGSRKLLTLDGDLADTDRTIGIFYAGYLPDFRAATEIRCGSTELKPLYMAVGKIEYVVMPIRPGVTA